MKSTTYDALAIIADDRNLKASDSNNNDSKNSVPKSNEKYSLRQRQKRLTTGNDSSISCLPASANSIGKTSHSLVGECATYGSDHSDKDYVPPTSSLIKSRQKDSKAKTKAAPLSKYRRKTANARERTRMREINSAFENLRHCVPHTITGDETSSSNEKLTKITTLRLAMKYITVLTEALANPSFEADFLLECKNDGDHRFTTHNWTQQTGSINRNMVNDDVDDEDEDDDDDLSMSEEIVHPVYRAEPPSAMTMVRNATTVQTKTKQPRTKATSKSNVSNNVNRKAPTKRQRNKQKLNDSVSPYSSSSSSCSSTSSSTSAYASMSSSAEASPPSTSSYLLESTTYANTCQSMTDLSSLGILESDGDSLSCLSPLNNNYHMVGSSCFPASLNNGCGDLSSYDTHNGGQMSINSLDNPLELSLRLLESTNADSLEFAADQQPSTCISPLETLDSFNPFADLLHSEFSEQSALDLFLT